MGFRGRNQGLAMAFADQLAEVGGPGCCLLARREAVEDEDVGADQLAHALVSGVVRVVVGPLGRIRPVLVKRTFAPWRMACWPRGWATCVFPTPIGPNGFSD